MAETELIISELTAHGNEEKAVHLSYFFKTGKGQYGEGDRFMGVTVPEQRAIALKYAGVSFRVLDNLISSPFHEQRLTALLILTYKFAKTKQEEEKQAIVGYYISHTRFINNWDLVDLSCYKILGEWLHDKDKALLYEWAKSDNFWEQRIAMVTCMHFVRKGDFKECLAIADLLLHHPHDLIHKAVGWLLREVGKKDKQTLTGFLRTRYRTMPRTMLRYAIERFGEEERKQYLHSEI